MTVEFVPASALYDAATGERTAYWVAVTRALTAHAHGEPRGGRA